MEDSVTDIETFDGCSVIFRNVKEYYSTRNSITCTFSVKVNCVIDESENCYIGLFHVGWDTLIGCVIKKCFTQVEHLPNGFYAFEFLASEIPESNVDEFYQFCFYDIKTEVVFGASCPFQICELRQIESLISIYTNDSSSNSNNTNCVEDGDWWISGSPRPVDEDFEDTVLVHNKTTMLKDSLAKTVEENEVLKANKANIEAELTKVAVEKRDFEKKVDNELNILKDKALFQEKREALLKQNILDSEEVINHLTAKFENMTNELHQEKHSVEVKNQEYNTVLAENEKLVAKLNKAVELNERRSDVISKQVKDIKYFSDKCNTLKTNLEAEQNTNKVLAVSYEDMVTSHESKKYSIEQGLQDQLNDTERKLSSEKKRNAALLDDANHLASLLERLESDRKEKDDSYLIEKNKLLLQIKDHLEMNDTLTKEKEEVDARSVALEKKCSTLIEVHDSIVLELENKISNIESVHNSDILKHSEDIENLEMQVTSKDQQIVELENTIIEINANISEIQATAEVERTSSKNMIDELELNRMDLEDHITHLNTTSVKSERSSHTNSLDAGARHALQIAYIHMQKQLKNMKKEKDNYQKLYNQQLKSTATDDEKELKRLNEEMKMRLCMGKTAYQEKYIECQRLGAEIAKLKVLIADDAKMGGIVAVQKTDANIQVEGTNTSPIKEDEHLLKQLLNENEKLAKKYAKAQKELADFKEHENLLLEDVERLKGNSKKLADHYEGKMNLLEEENIMIRKQKDALLKGDYNNYPTHNAVVEKQPSTKTKTVIYHPPSTKERVVEKQPDVLDKILYPPSFNVIDGHKKAWLPTPKPNVKTKPNQPSPEVATFHILGNTQEPPASQMMPSRENPTNSKNIMLRGRGQVENTEFYQPPTFSCPVCDMEFPPGLSNTSATNHVNSHFQDGN